MANKERYLTGTVSALVREAANDCFDEVKQVDLSLTTNDQAFSYEDTWHLTVECIFVELDEIREFISVISGDHGGAVMVDICATKTTETLDTPQVCMNFPCWKSEVEDLWGDCPELVRAPWPGMEFERPDHCDFGLL